MAVEKTNRDEQYKDRSPSDTISTIRNILESIGLTIREEHWRSFRDRLFAVSISATRGSQFVWKARANGKGVSKELALASAYGELIERIQNICIPGYMPRQYGLMPLELRFADEQICRLQDTGQLSGPAASSLISRRISADLSQYATPFAPFYELFERKAYYLPTEVLYWRCMSNGLCAGNRREEALVQGICEIFERYAARKIFVDRISPPTIPGSALEGLHEYDACNEFANLGYHVEVKDCTLGGRIPVLGILFFDKQRGRCHFHLGSHPILHVALSRCLTETIQAVSSISETRDVLAEIMEPVDWESESGSTSVRNRVSHDRLRSFYSFYRNGRTSFPSSLFGGPHNGKVFRTAFLESWQDNVGACRFLLNIVQRSNFRLFLRDVSFLGFPSFRVYIPDMSEIFPTYDDDSLLELAFSTLPQMQRTLLSLGTSTDEEIQKCASSMSDLFKHPRFPMNEFATRWGINVKAGHPFASLMDVQHLRSMLHLRLGQFTNAYTSMKDLINTRCVSGTLEDAGTPSLLFCMLACTGLKAANESDAEIAETLRPLFGHSLTEGAISTLVDHRHIFQNYGVPQCGDCEHCRLKESCGYNDWADLVQTLTAKMKCGEIDQAESISSLADLCPKS